MSKPEVFAFEAYKDYFRAQIAAEEQPWGVMTRLADAAGCQRPYLSRVLTQEAHLSSAQAFGLARYWGLSSDETDYFLGLVEIERAGSSDYREYWKTKITDIRRRHENLGRIVSRGAAQTDERDLMYYSSWEWTAMHILVSIPDYQTERAIADRLALPISEVRSILKSMEEWGAIQKRAGRWVFRAREQHISKHSPLSAFHHANWRERAVADSRRGNDASVHYTVVQSLSRADFEKVKLMILQMIKAAAEIAGPSREEKLMCFTCDLFEV